jgi:hypothetical protein
VWWYAAAIAAGSTLAGWAVWRDRRVRSTDARTRLQ